MRGFFETQCIIGLSTVSETAMRVGGSTKPIETTKRQNGKTAKAKKNKTDKTHEVELNARSKCQGLSL